MIGAFKYRHYAIETGSEIHPRGHYWVIRGSEFFDEPEFTGIGTMAYWWSSNKNARKSIRKHEIIVYKIPKKEAYYSCLCGDVTGGAGCLGSFSEGYPLQPKSSGLSVRLVKDQTKINPIGNRHTHTRQSPLQQPIAK